MSSQGAIVFLDFDGTITSRDATDAILEAYADRAWLELEDAWLAGRIGSRECLSAQMDLVTASPEEVDRLLDDIGVDPGFVPLLDVCAARAIPVHVVSDGFDYCIRRILGRPSLDVAQRVTAAEIVSSRLRPEQKRWRASFPHPPDPCAHGCATCKPGAMTALSPVGALTVFVGDGMSDRYAAQSADIVFAKGRLAAYCATASIPYESYETLASVATSIRRWSGADIHPRRIHSRPSFPSYDR